MSNNLTDAELKKRVETNKKIMKYGCLPISIIGVVVILLSIFSKGDDDKIQSPPVNDTSSGHIISSIETYETLFNDLAKRENFKYTVSKSEITKAQGEKGSATFKNMFAANLGIVGVLNEDETIRSLTIIMSGQGEATDVNFLEVVVCLIYASNPTLIPEERGQILKGLGIVGNDDLDLKDHSASTVKNGIKYFVTSNETIGVWIGAEPFSGGETAR